MKGYLYPAAFYCARERAGPSADKAEMRLIPTCNAKRNTLNSLQPLQNCSQDHAESRHREAGTPIRTELGFLSSPIKSTT